MQILQKRTDGYHNIESVFYPVPFKDVLEIVPLQNAYQPIISAYGLPITGAASDNLCTKAWHLLKKDFADLPAVHIHLLKNVPMGSGLGGGSSDGAFMLQMLNDKFHLGLSSQQLFQYALQLGSDCPFFILNQPCYATARGEILKPIELDLSMYHLVLANPGIHISTAWAFSKIIVKDSLMKNISLLTAIEKPVEYWNQLIANDFEKPVFEEYPQIKALKENMYNIGAVYSAMSGSGSTVFGLFKNDSAALNNLPAPYTRIQL